MSPQPTQIQIPSPPPGLIEPTSSSHRSTNTLALLLPHPFLFHPSILSLLRKHYESFGKIHSWAPIQAFGRVLIVYWKEDDAMDAKRDGDRLEIGNPAEAVENHPDQPPAPGYFNDGSIKPSSSLVLRVYLAVPTPLTPPTDTHLEPPTLTRNFLISPPGSPPEGWEPIAEDPPNSLTLAADLMKALEAIAAAPPRRRSGEIATIIDSTAEGGDVQGPSVTVQDCTTEDGLEGEIPEEIFESVEGRRISLVKATVDSMGPRVDDTLFGGLGDAFVRKPAIVPTAMPPRI